MTRAQDRARIVFDCRDDRCSGHDFIDDSCTPARFTVGFASVTTLLALKVVAAVVTIIGLLFGFLERYFAPTTLVTEDSPNYPDWLAWLGWILTTLGVLAYIAINWLWR
jgi:uncharacterized protein involved in cysteine biosynthesis